MEKYFKCIEIVSMVGSYAGQVKNIVFDSRRVEVGSIFVATVGTQVDGHDYIERAVDAGAVVVVCERMPDVVKDGVLYVRVEDSMTALSMLAAEFYGNPSRELKLVGVTGTNGKTTTATLLHGIFRALGYGVGLLSTVVNRVNDREVVATHTTPDAVELNRLLREMVDSGCEYCFMEVSSHGVSQKRVEGLYFTGGVFTNLTHDHLDYHGTFAEYLKVKKRFFDGLDKNAFALVNVDDKNGAVMLQNCAARKRGYSLRTLTDYKSKVKEAHLDGMLLDVNGIEVWVGFMGRFNAYNLTAIYGVAIELGIDKVEVLRVLSLLHPVAGRFQTLRSSDGVLGVVDYAHTPDALKNVLETIGEFRGGGKVVTVVGCGGDRDRSKRPVMAQIAVQGSDRVVLTSDNPRGESARAILDDMLVGVDAVERKKVLVIEDRGEAIRTAVALAGSGDIVLIAGKGHENYQDINGVKHHFDDMEQLSTAFV